MKGKKQWKRLLVSVGCVLATMLAGGMCALLRTPSWYEVPRIPPQERQNVRNNLVAAEQAFTEGVRTSRGPFVYHLYQDDVNRWIAMRREIYPLIDELAPPELGDPMVIFDQDELTVAGKYRTGAAEVVVSIDVSVRFEANSIVLRLKGLRCGSIGVPLSFVSLGLTRRIDRPAGATWPGSPRLWGDFQTGFHVDSRAWWKNGGIDYCVRNVSVEPGVLNLTVEPIGHHAGRGRKDQD